MVQISGKYKLVENKNWYEFVLALGLPEDKAKASNEAKATLEIKVDGDKVFYSTDAPKYSTTYIVGKEITEDIAALPDVSVKSTIQIDGNVLKIQSKSLDGKALSSRTLTFSDTGMEGSITATKDGKTLTATRIYKRI